MKHSANNLEGLFLIPPWIGIQSSGASMITRYSVGYRLANSAIEPPRAVDLIGDHGAMTAESRGTTPLAVALSSALERRASGKLSDCEGVNW